MRKYDTSIEAYQNYMSNMIQNNQPNIMTYDDWVDYMNSPVPDELKSSTEEISYEEVKRLGVSWTSEQELKELGIIDE